MTTGIFLGTGEDEATVYKVARAVGFDVDNYTESGFIDPTHTEVPHLRLQIHIPAYLSDLEDVVTEMEFDDFTDRFPDNPEALEVLGKLYERLPDMVYRESFFDANNRPEAKPLSEYLKRLENGC